MKMSRDKLHLLELSGFEREQLARIPDSYIVTCADRTSVSAAMVKEADVIIGRVPGPVITLLVLSHYKCSCSYF